ncbi:MAG TPA: DUF6134 family protein [Chitinophagaceae bacterium]|nr:DUF6134 family protein [Chitinophagaceae bacterium]
MKQKIDREVVDALMIKKAKVAKIRLCFFAFILLSIILTITLAGFSQTRALNFQIIRNDNKIGEVRFSENSSGTTDSLKMESNVKTKFIFTFIGYVLESATFRNGVLLQSSIYRKFNGDEKVNKTHRAQNTQYVISKGKNSKVLEDYPITYNMLSLYSKEPVNISKVYSDNFEKFLSINKLGNHKYKIILPDDNYNLYHYIDGVLNLVEVHHTFYTVKFMRINH